MKNNIIQTLKAQQGNWVSGAMLCQSLGVSRTAVWKHVGGLREAGYDIEARANLGYRLVSSPDAPLPTEVIPGLSTRFMGQKLAYYPHLGSTNAEANQLARSGCPEGMVVVAEEQQGGRGRLGRGWFSPGQRGLWFSVVLRPPVAIGDTPQVTMVLAVAVAMALREHAGVAADIKWPNDILVQGKKICGILVELKAEMDLVHFLVAGIGINVNLAREDFPRELVETATSLQLETGALVPRVPLLRAVLVSLERWYQLWLREGFAPVLAAWRGLCVTLNCPVTIHNSPGGQSYTGQALDVDETGALLVQRDDDGTVERLMAGEVSLRKM